MKKDKEWLKEEINKVTSRVYGTDFNTIKETDDLIDQLDEPEITEERAWKIIAKSTNRPVMFWENMRDNYLSSLKEPELPVIPQFVADRIKEYKDIQFGISLIFMINRQIDEDVEFSKWLSSEKDNCEIVARAWLDGYEIEKEPKYLVILANGKNKGEGQALYKDFDFNGDKVVSTHIEFFNKRTALEADNFCFTEQEIKAIDERYWSFAEEVTK